MAPRSLAELLIRKRLSLVMPNAILEQISLRTGIPELAKATMQTQDATREAGLAALSGLYSAQDALSHAVAGGRSRPNNHQYGNGQRRSFSLPICQRRARP